jgi:enterochelin esterase-like enzyme
MLNPLLFPMIQPNKHNAMTIHELLNALVSEKRLAKRMKLANEFRARLETATMPIVTDSQVIFVWEGASKAVNLVGDWTHWRNHLPMQRVGGTSLFYLAQDFPPTARLQYKFVVDGTWQNDPRNSHASQEGFGTNSEFMMPAYRDESWLQPAVIDGKPLQRGEIVRIELETALLPEKRELFVYLPPRYGILQEDQEDNATTPDSTPLPFLVMHDGAESISLGQFHHILDHCIHAELVKPCIAVFIAPHLPRRNEEYTLNADYLKFCMEEAVPKGIAEAEARGYAVSTKPVERCVAGASLGGLLATYMALHHPTDFGVVFAQSPAYWWQRGMIFNDEHLQNAAQIHAILQTGTIADAHTLTQRMRNTLRQHGAKVVYSEFVQGHTWGNWRTSFAQGMVAWSGLWDKT